MPSGRGGCSTCSGSSERGHGRHLGAVPGDRALDALAELCAAAEAEELLGPLDVEPAPRLAVRLRVVPDDLAGVAGRLGDHGRELADRDLVAGAEVDRVRTVVVLRGQPEALGAILDVEELPRRRAVTPEHDRLVAALGRLEHPPDQGRDHMRALEIEVVARPVEVHRQQVDRVQPVLGPVALRADEQRLLRDPVGSVRLLGVSVPEVFLAKGHRSELGIGADRSGDDELVHAGDPALLENVRPHEQVRVPVAARVLAVRADPADLAGEVEDEVRRSVAKQARRVLGEGQVVVAAARDKGVVPRGAKPLDEVRAEESAPAGDEDLHAADTRRVAISVVTVAYGAGPSLGRLLDSLAGEADEVVVVDNGEGGEEIAEASAREGVRVVSPGENLGFAAGSNLGAREAGRRRARLPQSRHGRRARRPRQPPRDARRPLDRDRDGPPSAARPRPSCSTPGAPRCTSAASAGRPATASPPSRCESRSRSPRRAVRRWRSAPRRSTRSGGSPRSSSCTSRTSSSAGARISRGCASSSTPRRTSSTSTTLRGIRARTTSSSATGSSSA